MLKTILVLIGLLLSPVAAAQVPSQSVPSQSMPTQLAQSQSDWALPFGGAAPDRTPPLTDSMPGAQPGGPLAPALMSPEIPGPLVPIQALTSSRPIVVELFTSEGCSSCPPANAYLAELARRPQLLALSFHVDYWDYIGWQDRFADPANAERQRAYAKAKGKAIVYTPQVVIAGAIPVIGSDRRAVEGGLEAAQNRKAMAEPSLVRDAAGAIHLRLPATPLSVPAALWFVTYSRQGASDVTAGENEGRRMESVNIVRSLRRLGQWDGGILSQTIDLTPDEIAAAPDACAIIANEAEFGPVVAAAAWDFSDLR